MEWNNTSFMSCIHSFRTEFYILLPSSSEKTIVYNIYDTIPNHPENINELSELNTVNYHTKKEHIRTEPTIYNRINPNTVNYHTKKEHIRTEPTIYNRINP
eukprot:194683_1